MIVDTMTANEVRKEYKRDLLKLLPIIERFLERLSKKVYKAEKNFYQTQRGYPINRNYYVVNYVIDGGNAVGLHWHYISNSDQPYFLASLETDEGEEYYARIDPHAILRYIERTPDYIPPNKQAFAKEAMIVAMDLYAFTCIHGHFITPSGIWPLESMEIVNGFLRLKTFIHKSTLTRRQAKIYKDGLQLVPSERIPVFEESMKEFGIFK
jgi:hypothetical protein